MTYQELFETVRHHLATQGATCEIRPGPLATEQQIAAMETRIKFGLGKELRSFFQTMGNGLSVRWIAQPDHSKSPFANLQIPNLDTLAERFESWRSYALYSPQEAEKYGFPYTKDPALAKRTAARMWHWLPIIDEGNGDQICLDVNAPDCPVVFNNHEWMDGGTGDNGHPMAPNWRAFLIDWGRVCFQFPQSLDWPFAFKSGGGIDWDGKEFREPFRIPGLINARHSV